MGFWIFLSDLREYIALLTRRWVAIVMGSLLFAVSIVYEHFSQRSITWQSYVLMLAIATSIASYGVWREEKSKNRLPSLRASVREVYFQTRMTSLMVAESLTDIFVVLQVLVENIGSAPTNVREIQVQMTLPDGRVLQGRAASLDNLWVEKEIHTRNLTRSFKDKEETKISNSQEPMVLEPKTSFTRWVAVVLQDTEKENAEASTLLVSVVDGIGIPHTVRASQPWPRTGTLVQRSQ